MLAILGGTGPEGKGLALRLAMAGETPIIGSRGAARGAAAAEELAQSAPNITIKGSDNAGAVAEADVVFLAFPYEGQRPVLEDLGQALKGVDTTDHSVDAGDRRYHFLFTLMY